MAIGARLYWQPACIRYNTQQQRNVLSGDILERQEPTIKAADDATRLFDFYQSGAKNGDLAVLIVGECAVMMRGQPRTTRGAVTTPPTLVDAGNPSPATNMTPRKDEDQQEREGAAKRVQSSFSCWWALTVPNT